MSDKRVKVSIDDMNFYVVGDNDSAYVKKLADDLDLRIKQTQNSNYKLNQAQSLILTALNILDEKNNAINEENSIKEVKDSDDVFRKNVKELEEIKDLNKRLEDKNSLLEKEIEKLNKKLSNEREENQSFTSKIEIQNKELEDLKAKLAEVKSEKEVLEKYEVFDVYTGEGIDDGMKSLAFSVIFRANDRTLKDEEVNEIIEKIIEDITKDLSGKLRE